MDINHIHNHHLLLHQHTPTTSSKLPIIINNTIWEDTNFSMAMDNDHQHVHHHNHQPNYEQHHHHHNNLNHLIPLFDHYHHHHQQQVWPNQHLHNLIPTSSSFIHSTTQPSSLAIKPTLQIMEQNNDVLLEEEEGEDEQEEEEELGAMKEMMYRYAVMQPVDIDPATIRKPMRRNVRISNDPQSVAARHRRERISEKIRILQRLVPGGIKMDTASMLDEAVRYVKFLKRQIRQLQRPPQPSSNHHHPPPVGWPTTSSLVGPATEGNPIEAKVVLAPRDHHNNHTMVFQHGGN